MSMKLNVNEYMRKVEESIASRDIAENILVALKPNKSKLSNGSFQLNVIVKNQDLRKKAVYSIYINEFYCENKQKTSVMVVDSSAFRHNMLFFNVSDNSIEKSYTYIDKIISNGIEKVSKEDTNRKNLEYVNNWKPNPEYYNKNQAKIEHDNID